MPQDYPRPLLERPECFEFAMSFIGDPEETELRRYIEALEARAALAQPEPQGPTDEELLDAFDQAVAAFPPVHPEAEPLSAVEYARELEIRRARAVLARWGRPTSEEI